LYLHIIGIYLAINLIVKMDMKILVVEDEPKVASFIKQGLEEQRNEVDLATDGTVGQKKALENNYDVVVLDVMLPHQSGFDICKNMRAVGVDTPVLMLTALNTTEDKLTGFDMGADDYLIKPFEFKELLARLKALSKRKKTESLSAKLTIADLIVDTDAKVVRRTNKIIDLTHKEYDLLVYLMKNQNKVVSRSDISENVWDIHFDTRTNVIDVYINFLRKKIDKDYSPKLIHTVVGMGYMIKQN
jgi:two-component system copper resistance phosphate regulon response regulator CusR